MYEITWQETIIKGHFAKYIASIVLNNASIKLQKVNFPKEKC